MPASGLFNGVSDPGLDPDSDGLSNLEESYSGTDPLNADSDSDGVSDGYEVNIYGTDPSKADSDDNGINDGDEDFDEDGLPNSDEVNIYCTDPLVSDTDGDGLDDFWERYFWGDFWNADPDEDGLINMLDADSDNDGVSDGVTFVEGNWDRDSDGTIDSEDAFPYDASESLDTDNDGTGDNADLCPNDGLKIDPGTCGCGVVDIDSDGDTVYDCEEEPAIVTTEPSGSTSEIGNTASFFIKLKSPPDGAEAVCALSVRWASDKRTCKIEFIPPNKRIHRFLPADALVIPASAFSILPRTFSQPVMPCRFCRYLGSL